MDFKSALMFLDRRISFERLNTFDYSEKSLNLDRFRAFLQRAGVDFDKLKYVHVAGSKGKGSVSSMFSQYFELKGMKIGLFTSPHIHSVCERIKLNNVDIPEEKFAECLESLADFIEDESYFEIINAIAFRYFLDEGVDLAVLEVGLGGRLDSTNVVRPILSVITRLELEHTAVLGDTLEEIAREKFGIVKEGVPVVVGQQSKEALEIAQRLCGRAKFVDFEGDVLGQNAELVKLGLMEISQFDEAVFGEMLANFAMKGRFDMRVIDGTTVIFDMAHTVVSVKALFERVARDFPGEKISVIISLLKGKKAQEIAEIVEKNAQEVVCVQLGGERALAATALAEHFKNATLIEDPSEALDYCINKNRLLVVTGSTYLLEKLLPVD